MRVLQATQQTSRHDCFHSAIGICRPPTGSTLANCLGGQAHEGIIGGAEGVADHDVSDTALDRIEAQACGLSQDGGAGGGLLEGRGGGARGGRGRRPPWWKRGGCQREPRSASTGTRATGFL